MKIFPVKYKRFFETENIGIVAFFYLIFYQNTVYRTRFFSFITQLVKVRDHFFFERNGYIQTNKAVGFKYRFNFGKMLKIINIVKMIFQH